MKTKFIYTMFIFLITINVFSYQAKIVFIDNNFDNLRDNNIEKVVYLSSEIVFDIKKGTKFNLYRNIEDEVKKTIDDGYDDLNKENNTLTKLSDQEKKVCVMIVEVISVVDNLIKAKEIKSCQNTKNKVLGEFQKSKIDDFIEIETIFDKKNEEKLLDNKLGEAFASIYMLGVDEDFNYLLESGINEINKNNKKKKEVIKNGDKNKNLPRKIKKRKKINKKIKKTRKINFEDIRL